MKKLQDKVAIVTGAGRGIGQAIALKLASEGARVVVNDLDAEPANDTVNKIRERGGEAFPFVGNVTGDDFGERFIETALTQYGSIDIIINNAGFVWDNVIQKMTDNAWQTIMDVHLTAPFKILRAASGYIRESARKERDADLLKHRKVVNISSISGLDGNGGQINYSAAKAGVVGMTKAMSKEWGRYGVNVNCVAFGPIDTRLTMPTDSGDATIHVEGEDINVGIHPDTLAMIEKATPLGRHGTVEEASGAVYLMCIPESDFITGQTIVCSGGLRS